MSCLTDSKISTIRSVASALDQAEVSVYNMWYFWPEPLCILRDTGNVELPNQLMSDLVEKNENIYNIIHDDDKATFKKLFDHLSVEPIVDLRIRVIYEDIWVPATITVSKRCNHGYANSCWRLNAG